MSVTQHREHEHIIFCDCAHMLCWEHVLYICSCVEDPEAVSVRIIVARLFVCHVSLVCGHWWRQILADELI